MSEVLKQWEAEAHGNYFAINCADDDSSVIEKSKKDERILKLIKLIRKKDEVLKGAHYEDAGYMHFQRIEEAVALTEQLK